jgi:hypothetical protein
VPPQFQLSRLQGGNNWHAATALKRGSPLSNGTELSGERQRERKVIGAGFELFSVSYSAAHLRCFTKTSHSRLPLLADLSKIATLRRIILPKKEGFSMSFYRLKITLLDVHRPIWRRFVVPSDIRLGHLHEVIQAVMGWYNCHLHEFEANKQRYKTAQWIDRSWDDALPEEKYSLQELASKKGAKIGYCYDFGDNWCHNIVVEDTHHEDSDQPGPIYCIEGVGACPPEDCGSTHGFAEFCEIMADPKHPEYKDYKEWFGGKYDPDHFDLDVVNKRLGVKRSTATAKKGTKKSTKKTTKKTGRV